MCATASYARVQDGRTSTTGLQNRVCRNEVTNGSQNMKMEKFDFRKNDNAGSVFGRIFLKMAANGYLKVTHSYSRFS